MTDYADLEIALHPHEGDQWRVEMRLRLPGGGAPTELLGDEPPLVGLDVAALGAIAGKPVDYGQKLADSLFTKEVGGFFEQSRSLAASHGATLRVRLRIPRTAPQLHKLRWETLRDPKKGANAFLFSDEKTPFSRYLPSDDLRPVKTRPREDLKALVVIANPTNLGGWHLAEVQVAGELKRARDGLGDIKIGALCRLDGGGEPLPGVEILGPPTLNELARHLRDRYEILYLVCHGALETEVVEGVERDVPKVWLEQEDGSADVVSPDEDILAGGVRRAGLVTRLDQLPQVPRLIVLSACQSAGKAEEWTSTDAGALSALGPRLAEAGVPAVIAMQGDVKMKTVELFMPAFFEELLREENEGQIDRALAAARGDLVGQQPDWWAPALFMRLDDGRIAWHEPGFRVDGKLDFEKWPALIERIHDAPDDPCNCTPILGPGLMDCLLGSVRKLARNWAQIHRFPLAADDWEDLPAVAQYVSLKQDRKFPYEQLPKELRRNILEHYRHLFEADLAGAQKMPLDQLVDRVGAWLRTQDPADPYRVLAGLPFPVYITANPDNLLASALRDPEFNRTPHVALCPWKDELIEAYTPYTDEPTYDQPLLYHLFGKLDQQKSIVLTQDDYFDFLIGVTRHRDLIPSVVRTALTDRLLLFLGFQIDDWSFRMLLRSIVRQSGSSLLEDYAHVAVQLDPGDERAADPEAARAYLETYFQKTAISIYWGRTEDFLRELRTRWNEKYGKERPL
jgi:hypothetical protein